MDHRALLIVRKSPGLVNDGAPQIPLLPPLRYKGSPENSLASFPAARCTPHEPKSFEKIFRGLGGT